MISFLFVDTERVWRGGQDQLLTLLAGLLQRDHDVHLVCHPSTLLEKRALQAGIRVHPLDIPREVALLPYVRLWKILRRSRPQVLLFNTPRPILLGSLVSRLSSVRTRIIFRRVNFPLRRSLFTRLKYTRGVDCIIAISESIRQQLQTGGVPPEMIRTIYEGMDLSHYPARPEDGRRESGAPTVVGTIAHLSPEKGLHYLVEAAALIPDAPRRLRFVVVGDGACREELETQVRDRGLLPCFEFAGFQSMTHPYLQRFDVFVLPSLSEGLSSAILAAMASSLPVVATRVGGIPELIQHEVNGLLIPPADAGALARAIQRIAEDPARAAEMGRAGRRRVEEQFTLERKITETEALCARFLNQSEPASHAVHA